MAAGAMVEFAIAMGIFFVILVAILSFGYAAWERNSVAADAREGARYASVRGTGVTSRTTTAAAVQTYVRSLSALGSSVLVSTVWNPDKKPGSVVTVTVTHVRQGRLFLPDTMRSSSAMIILF